MIATERGRRTTCGGVAWCVAACAAEAWKQRRVAGSASLPVPPRDARESLASVGIIKTLLCESGRESASSVCAHRVCAVAAAMETAHTVRSRRKVPAHTVRAACVCTRTPLPHIGTKRVLALIATPAQRFFCTYVSRCVGRVFPHTLPNRLSDLSLGPRRNTRPRVCAAIIWTAHSLSPPFQRRRPTPALCAPTARTPRTQHESRARPFFQRNRFRRAIDRSSTCAASTSPRTGRSSLSALCTRCGSRTSGSESYPRASVGSCGRSRRRCSSSWGATPRLPQPPPRIQRPPRWAPRSR